MRAPHHPTDPMDAYQLHLLRLIETHGHAVQGVIAEEDEPGSGYAYTVGRTTMGEPELLVTGLCCLECAAGLLNRAAEVGGLVAGQVRDDLGDAPLRVLEADPRTAEVFMAEDFYPTGFELLQLVWPDDAGRYPDELHYDHARRPQALHPRRGWRGRATR